MKVTISQHGLLFKGRLLARDFKVPTTLKNPPCHMCILGTVPKYITTLKRYLSHHVIAGHGRFEEDNG